ncbi:MAG: hypothetical protein M3R63_13785 [Actinomycetota bacterium]|nr:hypothetical protein [Actinomycetota bacterium]
MLDNVDEMHDLLVELDHHDEVRIDTEDGLPHAVPITDTSQLVGQISGVGAVVRVDGAATTTARRFPPRQRVEGARKPKVRVLMPAIQRQLRHVIRPTRRVTDEVDMLEGISRTG